MGLGRQDPWIGQQLGQSGRYQLDALLGQGGMGRVYKAVDRKLSLGGVPSYRAIKLLNVDLATSPDGRERFRREMQACILLQNPHIVRFFDYGVVLSQAAPDHVVEIPFTVMEWIPGITLEEVLEQVRSLTVAQVIKLGCQLTSGLQSIHRGISIQGKTVRFVHRDLKPANIFMLQTDQEDLLKIGDFGFVKFVSDHHIADLTQTGQYGGTPDYSSPEQLIGSKLIDGRSDLYSLGCILYEMLSGQNPFGLDPRTATMPQWIEAHLKRTPRSFDPALHIPRALEVAVLRCLEKDPASRFGTASDLENSLLKVQAHLAPSQWPPPLISIQPTSPKPAPSNTYEELILDILDAYKLKLQVFKQESWLHLTLIHPPKVSINHQAIADIVKQRLVEARLDITQLRIGSRAFGSAQLNWSVDYDLTIKGEDELPVQDDDDEVAIYAQPTYVTTTDLVADELTDFLESSLPDSQLRLRLKQRSDTLHILISHPPKHPFDFEAVTRRLAHQVKVVQIPGIHRLEFYSRIRGTQKPDNHRLIDLRTDLQSPEPVPVSHRGAERATVEAKLPVAPIAPQEVQQVPSSASQEVKLSELERVERVDLSQYQFVRNKTLLTTQLPLPDPNVAQLVIFFHDLNELQKHNVLPALKQFFQDPAKLSLSEFTDDIQNWFRTIEQLSERHFKSVAVWLSRYCQNQDRTLAEVTSSLAAVMHSSESVETSEGELEEGADFSDAEADRLVLYRSHSHWISSVVPLFALLCQLLGVAILLPFIPSPLGWVGLGQLPHIVQGILALALMGLTLRLLIRHKWYDIALTRAVVSIITIDVLFRKASHEIRLAAISNQLQIDRDPLGQMFNYGTVTLSGRQLDTQILELVANPHQLWTQIQYLKQQLIAASAQPEEPAPIPSMSQALTGSLQSRCFGEDRRYCLEVVIGQGGMGRVYRATDRKLSVYVAIKFMLHNAATSSEAIERFKREMQACLGLQDERIVRVLDYGVTREELKGMESLPYLVMEYVSAPTLSEVLHRAQRFDVVRAVNIARQVALALHIVHAGSIINGRRVQFIHRDLKPSNIFLLKDPAGVETIKLADFGLVKIQGEISIDSLSETGQFRGTVNYAAPEQCEGRRTIDTRADIYSLGCLLYEMLTGINPYGLEASATPTQWMYAHVYSKAMPLAKSLCVPTQIETIIFRCLAKEPNTRYGTAKEVSEALFSALQS